MGMRRLEENSTLKYKGVGVCAYLHHSHERTNILERNEMSDIGVEFG